MKYTPGPWSACNNGKCKCKSVWSDDHPVAEVVHGKWGDDYPALRVVGPSTGARVEAYMEQVTYGEIDEEFAEGNARLIAAAPEMFEALADLTEWWEGWMPDDAREQGGGEVLRKAWAALAKAEGKAPTSEVANAEIK